jgi:hypothetical protein
MHCVYDSPIMIFTMHACCRWTDLLLTFGFPPLTQAPQTESEVPQEPAPPAKGKGKPPVNPPPPKEVVPEPLRPQFADPIRAAALCAVNAALSASALQRALRQKLLMHVVEACIHGGDAPSVAAAAALLQRSLTALVRIFCSVTPPPECTQAITQGTLPLKLLELLQQTQTKKRTYKMYDCFGCFATGSRLRYSAEEQRNANTQK